MLSDNPGWEEAREKAGQENPWFIPPFIHSAIENIVTAYLDENILKDWAKQYPIPEENKNPKTVGIIMAGNIPLVGFHDFLSVFISGHKALIKTSSKDSALIKHLAGKITEWEPETGTLLGFEELLKKCDAYIATGSNNSSRYFEYYFSRYPHIIRRNKTSVAILTGNESMAELGKLADDILLYFGRGCRNITKLYVPREYDFAPLLEAVKKYDFLGAHHRYKNNFDYNLTLHILNKKFYMSAGSLLLSENDSLFSPVGQLHYEVFTDKEKLLSGLAGHKDIQCIVGKGLLPFGRAQYPGINDYADGMDTLHFLAHL